MSAPRPKTKFDFSILVRIFTPVRFTVFLLILLALATILRTIVSCPVFKNAGYAGLVLVLGVNALACAVKRWTERKSHWGFFAIHVSLLLLIVGGLVSAAGRVQGNVQVGEGETVDPFASDGKTIPLGFQLRLKGFELQEYESREEKLIVRFPGRQKAQTFFFPLQTWAEIPPTPYRFRVERFVPDFRWDTQTQQVFSVSVNPLNPAVFVHVEGPGIDYGEWVFHRFPHFHGKSQKPLQLEYVWSPPVPKDFISHIEIRDGNGNVREKALRVNHPFRCKGFAVYQMGYDDEEKQWSELKVVKDPGVGIVYAGMAILLIALVYTVYLRPFLPLRNPSSEKRGGR